MGKRRYVQGQESINLRQRLYWGEQLGPGVITNLIDPFGDETEDEEDAVRAVVKINDSCWLDVDLTAYERRPEH